MVWGQLKTIFDPEIPVNISDLGLIYSCNISPLDGGGNKIDIKMSMTASRMRHGKCAEGGR